MTLSVWTLCAASFAQDGVEGVDMVNMAPVAFVSNDFMLTEKVNDIEVWHDEAYGESYLLVGCENGTALFKMMPDGTPVYMGKMATTTISSLWRDIKVVHEHAYVASEAPLARDANFGFDRIDEFGSPPWVLKNGLPTQSSQDRRWPTMRFRA